MKVIIFAEAKSPRLLPLTKELPISLLKIKERAVLDLQLESLSNFNFSEIIITTGFQEEKMESFNLLKNAKLFFNPFYDVSNIPASLYLLKDKLAKEDFILFYGDVLFKASLLKKIIEDKNNIVLAVDIEKRGNLDEEAEKVIIKEGLVKKLNKLSIDKEISSGEYVGLAKFSANSFSQTEKILKEVIKENLKTPFIYFLNALIDFGQPIHYIETSSESWTEIDFADDLEKAQNFIIK